MSAKAPPIQRPQQATVASFAPTFIERSQADKREPSTELRRRRREKVVRWMRDVVLYRAEQFFEDVALHYMNKRPLVKQWRDRLRTAPGPTRHNGKRAEILAALSELSVRHYLSILHLFFRYAVEEEIAYANPVERIPVPATHVRRRLSGSRPLRRCLLSPWRSRSLCLKVSRDTACSTST